MICNPADDLLHTSLHTWVFFRVFSALPDETVIVHQRLMKLAPEVGLVSATTHFIEFSTIVYNNLRHFTSSFHHVPNGVFHYKFLTVLLTVSTVTKMRLSSGNIH